MKKSISEICNNYNLGTLLNVIPLKSSQNNVYKIETTKNNYIIKEYNKDTTPIKLLNQRIEQIIIAEIFNKNNILTILPLKLTNNYFINNNNEYYLVYNYVNYKHKTQKETTIKDIQLLSKNLANMHKLNIDSSLSCTYKRIDINYNYYLELFQTIDKELYKKLRINIQKLQFLTNECNNRIETFSTNLCINHNDYKLLNILWDNNNLIYLIDFDACGYSHPIVALLESSFSLSIENKKLNINKYYEYILTYIKNYNKEEYNYEEAILFAMNGKLQWLQYILTIPKYKKQEILDMIDELVLYIESINKMKEIFNKAIKNIV